MVFQLNAQIPLAARGYDYGRSQANALRGLQMQAAEREVDEQNALAQVLRDNGEALTSDDPSVRGTAAAQIARTGMRGYQIAAPVLEAARNEREFAAIRGRFGGGAQVPVGPAGGAPAAMPGGATPAVAPADLMPLIEEASRETGIPVPILVAQIRQESNFNPAARGRAGEIGLAQIMPATARQPGFGVQPVDPARLSDPRENIMFGARYLAGRGRAAGVTDWNDPAQVDRALAAYNGGGDPNYVQNVRRWMPGTGAAPAAGGDAIPASAQGGAGGGQRMPGMPTPQQFAELVDLAGSPNPRVARWAQAQVQTWAPFMRRETGNPPAPVRLGDGPAGPAGMYIPDPSAPGGYRRVADAPVDAPQTVGTIPPGFQLERTPEGAFRMVPIPGGPAALAEQRAQRAEQAAQTGRERTGNIVIQDLDRALSLLDTARLPVAGFGAGTLAGVPGTAAADAARLLDSVRANVGFAQLNQMRAESPTGAALGQVTERELQFLQAVLGSLDQTQSPAQFRQNLERVRNVFLDIVHGPGQGQGRRPTGIEAPGAPPAGARPNDATAIPGPGGQGTATPPPPAPARPPLDTFFRQGR